MSEKLHARRKGRSLLIVEGKHEKEVLFRSIFMCFPELKIDEKNILVYGTNIYQSARVPRLTNGSGADEWPSLSDS